MKRGLGLVCFCLLFPAAGLRSEILSHPLAATDVYLPPYSISTQNDLLGLYMNPATLAMRPGEYGILLMEGLRGSNHEGRLADEFRDHFTGDWSLVLGGPLAFGLDRSRSAAGFDFDNSQAPPDTTIHLRQSWRYNLGLSHRFDLAAMDAQLALGAAYRWTRSEAYSLDGLGSWDLGAVFRWRRWISLGLCVRNVDSPKLRGRYPGEARSISPTTLFSAAVRPRLDWLTFSMDLRESDRPGDDDFDTLWGFELNPRGRARLRFDFDEAHRINAGLWLSLGPWRAGGSLGNQRSTASGTSYGAATFEWRNRSFGPPLLPKQRFLHLRMAGPIPEAPSSVAAAERPCTKDFLAEIARARREADLAGIVLSIEDPEIGLAQCEEIRNALQEYHRLTDRPVIAYARSFDTKEYFLATAADFIVLNPGGELRIAGLRLARPYVSEALSKLGIEPQLEPQGEGSSAVDLFTLKAPSPASIAADSALVRSHDALLRQAIAEGRGLPAALVDELMESAFFSPAEAKEQGLIDEILHEDQIAGLLVKEGGTEKLLSAGELARRNYTREGWGNDPAIALVYLTGMITAGPGGFGLFGPQSGAAAIGAALKEARENPRIRGVILRVDSGGGSFLASELLQREMLITRLAKPLVVSMGNAGSGGAYLVSLEASRILADRGSITGGIGVFGGKINLSAMLEKLGVRFEGAGPAGQPDPGDPLQPYSEAQRAQLKRKLEERHERFINKAGERRHIDGSELRAIAQGRISSGRDALELRLVDSLGGLDEAVNAVRSLAKIEPKRGVELLVLPRRPGRLARLLSREAKVPGVLPGAGEDLGQWMKRMDPFGGDEILSFEPAGCSTVDPAALSP